MNCWKTDMKPADLASRKLSKSQRRPVVSVPAVSELFGSIGLTDSYKL